MIQADQAKLQHAVLQLLHGVGTAGVLQQLIVDAERLPDFPLLLEAFSLPHAGMQTNHLAAVFFVDFLKLPRGASEDFAILVGPGVVGLTFLVGANRKIKLRAEVGGLDLVASRFEFRLFGINRRAGELVPFCFMTVVRRLKYFPRLRD